ncbi:hypothetical protein MASR1M59_00380 [Melaminivora sp.]
MANEDLKAKLVLQASATGGSEIEALAQHLQDLAREGGDAAPKFDALAQSLRDAAGQQQLIDAFVRLKREAQDTAQALDAATARVDGLAAEQAQAARAAQEAAQAQAQAAQALQAARAHQDGLREAVAQARVELKNSRAELKQAGDGQAVYAERVRDAAAQLKVLQAEQQQAAGQVRLLSAAYQEGEAATRNAARAQADVGAQYDRAVTGAAQLSAALQKSQQALQGTRDAMQAAGVDTKGLNDQQAALKLRLQEGAQQAQLYAGAVQEMRGQAQALAPALEATFKQLGMRGVQQITAEIERLQAAMRGLKGQKMLPEDAARASAELQQRIELLRAEMGGVQGAARGAGNAVQDLGHKADGASGQIGAAAHKAAAWVGAMAGLGELKQLASAVVNTGSSFEQLQRRLTSILGSADKAREAFAMLKDLAQQTPFDVQGLTEAYAKLSAFGLKPSRDQMLAMADTAAALGGGTEMLAGVTLALGQAWTKGKLQGEEMLQLAERGVPAWDLLAKATGRNVQELQKMAEAGLLGRDAILQLIDAMGKKSAGASAELMNSYAGAVQRAQDALQEFFNMIAQSGVLEYLTQQLQGLLLKFDALKASGQLDQWAKSIADGFRGVAESAQNMFVVLQALEPVLRLVVAAMVARKAADWADALARSSTAATGAADAHGKLEQAARGAGGALQAAARLASGAVMAWSAQQVLVLVDAIGGLQRANEKLADSRRQALQVNALESKMLREISDATGVYVDRIEQVYAAQKAGLLVQEEATGKWLSAAQAQEKLAGAVKQTVAQMAAADASVLVAAFEETATSAEAAKGAIEKLAGSLQFGDVKGVGAFVQALDTLAAKGKLSAEQVGDAWQQALSKLNAGQIGALRANLEEAARQGVVSAQQWAQVNEQVLAASFDKLGVNAAQALGKISTGAQEAIRSVDLVAESAQAAGVGVQDAARAIEMAFAAAVPKADSLQAVDALGSKLKALGDSGQVSADGLARMQALLDKQRATIEDQIPGIQSLGEALRQLGVKPQAELNALAESAKQAFAVVKNSGTATPREISQAWKAMAEAAIAANNGVADASLQAQAQQHGFVIEADAAGKAIVKSMGEAAQATRDVGLAAAASAQDVAKLSQAGWDSSRDLVAQARQHNAALAKTESSWIDASVAASKYSDELAKTVWDVHKPMQALTEEHAKLVRAMEALDEQQRLVERGGSGAAQRVQDLRLRLIELDGTEAQLAQARLQREQEQIKRQLKLAEIELERAQIRKDQGKQQEVIEEMRLLREQLGLQQQIFDKEQIRREQQQRQAREQQAQAREQQAREQAQREQQARQQQQAQAREQAEREQQARQQAEREQQARQQAEREQQQREQAQREQQAREQAEREQQAREQAEREQQAREPQARQPQAPAQRESFSAALSPAVFNVTLNANGVSDPARLARLLEPELKRLAALAR